MAEHLKCRFCGSRLLHNFVDLGLQPPSNYYRRPEQLAQGEVFYPLHAYVCSACWLVQLEDFQSPDDLFASDYAYFSSYSQSWLDHAYRYVQAMIPRFDLDATSQVVEIASNDGYLLQYFKEAGIPVLGIEPAANVAAVAEQERGIPTQVCFFGAKTARELAAEGLQADLIVANNVLAHVPDINDFVGGLPILLKSQGVITLEFPHLLQLIRHNQFDTIYHEHFSYLSLLAVERILAAHGLAVFDVEELPTHGGSLRLYATHVGGPKPVSSRVESLRHQEQRSGLTDLATYLGFGDQVARCKRRLLNFLIEARDANRRVVGYGAPAKGNTLLNYCGIGTDLIGYTVDLSPHKQDKFLPGSRLPIHAPDKIFETRPDYVLILPWNLQDEIMAQMAGIREWGGRFVVPIPEVRVLP